MHGKGLFRREALQHQQGRWLGEVRVDVPLAHSALLAVGLLLVSCAGAFVVIAHYTRVATASGVLVATHGEFWLYAPTAGWIQELGVTEGQRVRAGELLCMLRTERPSADAESHERKVAMALARRRAALQQSLAERESMLAQERARLVQRRGFASMQRQHHVHEVRLHAQRVERAGRERDRMRMLAAAGHLSRSALERGEDEFNELVQRSEMLQQAQLSLQREVTAATAELEALPLRLALMRSETRVALSALEQEAAELDSRRAIAVRASAASAVAMLLVREGQQVSAGQIIAALLPENGGLEAQIHVPSRAIGFLRRGQRVILRYSAYAWQKFGQAGGTIREISAVPLLAQPRQADPADAARAPDPLFRVRIALDRQYVEALGPRHRLQPGLQLEAQIPLERRRLIEWLFEPVLGLAQRIVS